MSVGMSVAIPPPVGAATDPAAAALAVAARAGQRDRQRLATLTRELFADDRLRIDEARRIMVRQLLDRLAAGVERDLRQRVADRLRLAAPAALRDALDDPATAIARPALDDVLADPELVGLLARRADEHRLVGQARLAAVQDPDLVARALFAGLLAHDGDGIAAAAAAVAVAESGRFDRFEEPLLAEAELPAAVYADIVWHSAAAIRGWIGADAGIGLAFADRAIAAAATGLLAARDPERTLPVTALALARLMLRTGLADDDATLALAAEGHVAVAVAGLALRAGIGVAAAWDMILDPDGARLVVLLRAAGLTRAAAATLLLRWPDAATPPDRIIDRLVAFDALPATAASDAIDLFRLDEHYARAIVDLGGGPIRR